MFSLGTWTNNQRSISAKKFWFLRSACWLNSGTTVAAIKQERQIVGVKEVSNIIATQPERDVSQASILPLGICQPKESDVSRQIELRAAEALECHPCFRGRGRWIQCRCLNRCLQLSGKLPSFYLKQLVQEVLRDLDGVDCIDNRIVVASPVGEVDQQGPPNEVELGPDARWDTPTPR